MSRGDGGAQAQSRSYEIKRDQHGRSWGYNVEGVGENRGRCGPLEPQMPRTTGDRPFNLDPRLRPPDKCVREGFAPNEAGDRYLYQARVHVDYELWKNDIRQAWTDFVRRVREEYSNRNILCDWTPGGKVGMRLDVREKVGPNPSPIEVPLACEKGNAWALHGVGPMPKALATYFGLEVQLGNVLADIENKSFDDPMPEAAGEEPIPDDDTTLALAEIEETFDPEATGGKNVPIKRRGRPPKDEARAIAAK